MSNKDLDYSSEEVKAELEIISKQYIKQVLNLLNIKSNLAVETIKEKIYQAVEDDKITVERERDLSIFITERDYKLQLQMVISALTTIGNSSLTNVIKFVGNLADLEYSEVKERCNSRQYTTGISDEALITIFSMRNVLITKGSKEMIGIDLYYAEIYPYDNFYDEGEVKIISELRARIRNHR